MEVKKSVNMFFTIEKNFKLTHIYFLNFLNVKKILDSFSIPKIGRGELLFLKREKKPNLFCSACTINIEDTKKNNQYKFNKRMNQI